MFNLSSIIEGELNKLEYVFRTVNPRIVLLKWTPTLELQIVDKLPPLHVTVLLSAKSTGGPNTQEGWKKFRNIINRGLDFENRA